MDATLKVVPIFYSDSDNILTTGEDVVTLVFALKSYACDRNADEKRPNLSCIIFLYFEE